MITAVTLALIVTMFTDQREQTRAIGGFGTPYRLVEMALQADFRRAGGGRHNL